MSDIPDGVPPDLDKPLTEWYCPTCNARKVFPNDSTRKEWSQCCLKNLMSYLTEIPADQLQEVSEVTESQGEDMLFKALRVIKRRGSKG